LKILLAPSETKKEGGDSKFDLNSLMLSQKLTPAREELFNEYNKIVTSNNLEQLSKMFGLKKEADILKYSKDISSTPTLKAIQRYTGVAFDHLEYESLEQEAQEYIDKNVILFSNLFGAIKANDKIPLYRLKQGETIGELNPAKIYKTALKEPLDNYLENEDIIDIRAGFYDKFYKPNKQYTTLKFLKGGKVVSHWAKAYRGIVLKHIAQNQITTIANFIAMPIKGLELLEIREGKQKQELIYQIEE